MLVDVLMLNYSKNRWNQIVLNFASNVQGRNMYVINF